MPRANRETMSPACRALERPALVSVSPMPAWAGHWKTSGSTLVTPSAGGACPGDRQPGGVASKATLPFLGFVLRHKPSTWS